MDQSPSYRHTFFRLLAFLRPYRWSLWISVVLAVGSQAAQVATAFLTGNAVGKAVTHDDHHLLHMIVLAVILVGVARALLMLGRRFISGNQALGVEYDIRNALYARLVRLSFGFYDRHQTGQLMSRATVDLQTVRFFLGYGLIFFFQHVLTVVGVTAVMLAVNWRLALVALAISPVLVVVAYRYSHVSHPVLREVQQKMADVATVAEENIVGVHVVKSFAQEEAEQTKFERRSQSVFDQSVAANRQRAIYVPALSFLPLLAQAGVVLVGGRMVVHGSLPFNDFITFNVLVMMLVMPLRMLGMWIGQAAAGDRVGRADLPGDGRARGDRRRTGRRRAAAGPGPHPLRAGLVRVCGGAAGAAGDRARARAGQDRRTDRAHRLREDDARGARPALLRRDSRPCHDRRSGRPQRPAHALCAGRSA